MAPKKMTTIDVFFKRKDDGQASKRKKPSTSEPEVQENQVNSEAPQPTLPQSNTNEVELNNLERDPAKRKHMCVYPVNSRELIRRAYLSLGPYQPKLEPHEYENKGTQTHTRRFKYSWFGIYQNWLEYYTTTHSAYCFLCYLFSDKLNNNVGYDAFTVKGFDNWKKVNGKNCSFLNHLGTSQHRNAMVYSENLLNQSAHIENVFVKQNEEQIVKNRLRLTATIDVIRLLKTYLILADAAYGHLQSFEFVFILHLMKEVMGKTDLLSQALQKKSQDILNAMELVSSTKNSLDDLRNNGWDSFLEEVTYFCEKHQIEMPEMNTPYTSTRYRPRKKDRHVTFEHYYRVDVFTSTLDKQLQELNSRFNENTMELLSLSSSLVSKKIEVEQICALVEKYYPEDFTERERLQLKYQLEIYNMERANNSRLSDISTLSDLCKGLVKTKKRDDYNLVDRVVRLILTLPVSTATTERGFSAMKIFKNRLRNKMSDEYLSDSLVVYIEREIAEKFDSNIIIDEFKDLKGRRVDL